MKIEEAREKILEYLEENGSANVSQLARVVGCGKSTLYDAIAELEAEGKIKSEMKRNQRVIVLTCIVPKYIKALFWLTLAFILFYYYAYSNPSKIKINFNGSEYMYIGLEFIPLFILSILVGFWLGVIILKEEDLEPIRMIIKRALDKIKDAVLDFAERRFWTLSDYFRHR